VNRKRHPAEVPLDSEPGTLGAVLYADEPAAATPSETEWAEIVASIAAGDTNALRALYERMHRIVFTLTMRISNDCETAEEITLDVFHDVWRRAGTYDPELGTVIAWIMNQARSRAIDRLRHEHRKKRTNPYPADGRAEPATHQADDSLGLAEDARLLRDALQTLTADERSAIETAYFSELSYTETADRLDQPVGTVKTRIRSGLRKLRKALAGRVRKA
jgi:RNA polymerase sigma-70 factor, ECF subfamily